MSARLRASNRVSQTPTADVLEFPRRMREGPRQESVSRHRTVIPIATPSATEEFTWYNATYTPIVTVPDPVVLVRSQAELERKFNALADQWRKDTAAVSSSTEIFSHEAYKRITALGEFAIPFILRAFERRQEHWDYALWLITGENPVLPECAGQMDEIAKAWVEWGKQHRYI